MELKRDIYNKLLEWKAANSGHVLEIRGARQVGKTYILDKFARENYHKYIYINMTNTTGRQFLECWHKVNEWQPGTPRREHPIHDAFMMYDEGFIDEKETIVVIDEIQESSEVYSLIRPLAREFKAHFVITGSYLGKTLSKEYFQPVGDLDIFTMYSLSFAEFADAFGKRELYENVDLYGESSHEQYDELKGLYEVYITIGGYPSVVTRYLETKDIKAAKEELRRILSIFVDESEHHFKNAMEMNIFEDTFPAIALTMLKEKKGSSDLIDELSSVIKRNDTTNITKASISRAISWLYRSKIIGYCNQMIECNPSDIAFNRRFYFMDLGICRMFIDMVSPDESSVKGIINENFVYLDILRRIDDMDISAYSPTFGTYKDGEIDFIIRKDYKNYAIEVKTGKGASKTARQVMADHKVEAVYLMKGDTYGGVEGNMITVPIYLAGRVKYDYVRSEI